MEGEYRLWKSDTVLNGFTKTVTCDGFEGRHYRDDGGELLCFMDIGIPSRENKELPT